MAGRSASVATGRDAGERNSFDELQRTMAAEAAAVEETMAMLLPKLERPEAKLFEAMRYGSLGGGKRFRPFLVLESARLFSVEREMALRVGAALEMIHCYSLIHDDLPAMDDGELRRGRPTVHRQFDEATAILAGDGLLTHAFDVLADPLTHPQAEVRIALVAGLARAAGPLGMVEGQMLDLIAETTRFDLDEIIRLQGMKTGAIIVFGCEAGAILGEASGADREALRGYGRDIGLVFQITDDLLDIEGSEEVVGKSVGRDVAAGKATFVSLLGHAGARSEARSIADRAVAQLDRFGPRAQTLRGLAAFVLNRKS
jgi:farnesyl diphosphate synthase